METTQVMQTGTIYLNMTFCPITKENCRTDCMWMRDGQCAIYAIAGELYGIYQTQAR